MTAATANVNIVNISVALGRMISCAGSLLMVVSVQAACHIVEELCV